MIRNLWRAVPGDLGDPLLGLWILGWNFRKILQFDFQGLWHANIFYPAPLVLAYSEHLFATALVGLPIYLLSGNLVFTYNFLFLASFVLSGWGMYLLVKDLTGEETPALLCGIILAFFPYRFAHLWHIQLLTFQWVPFVFLYLNRFLLQNSYANLCWFTIFFLLQALSCGYYALYLGLFVGLFIGYHFWLRRKLPDWSFGRKLSIFVLATALVAGPFFYPYLQVKKLFGFTRSLGETIHYSADLTGFLCAPFNNIVWGPLTQRFSRPEGQLHPGLILVLLALAGAVFFFNKKQKALEQKEITGFALLMTILAFMLSLGPIVRFMGRWLFPGPYLLLYLFVPGFAGLRVPARLAPFFVFGATILAAYGILAITGRLERIWSKRLTAVALGSLIVIEYLSIPLSMSVVPAPSPVYLWLSHQPGRAPVVELPILEGAGDVEYAYFSTFHWKDLVNGYSGYWPPWFRSVRTLLDSFPSDASLDFLEQVGVRYVIVHLEKLDPATRETFSASFPGFDARLRKVQDFGTDQLYQVTQTRSLTREAAAHELISRTGPGGVTGAPLKEFVQEISSPAPVERIRINEMVKLQVTVRNTSNVAWPAFAGVNPVHLAYHWLDSTGRLLVRDGERTGLPHDLAPGETASFKANIRAPNQPGVMILRLTMVQENVAWFENRGAQPLDIPVTVTVD